MVENPRSVNFCIYGMLFTGSLKPHYHQSAYLKGSVQPYGHTLLIKLITICDKKGSSILATDCMTKQAQFGIQLQSITNL